MMMSLSFCLVTCQPFLFPGEGEEQLYLVQRQRSGNQITDEFFLVVTEKYAISFVIYYVFSCNYWNVNYVPHAGVCVCSGVVLSCLLYTVTK
jgi:hypothetical protein